MGRFSCIRTTLIPILEASHSISKVLLKSGKDSNSVEINFDFNKLNALFYSSPHDFLNDFSQLRGYHTKVFNKPPIETSQTVKTSNFCFLFWCRPFLNSLKNLSLIHLYTFCTHNISKKNNSMQKSYLFKLA